MDREAALNIVKRAIKAKYGMQQTAAEALGMSELQVSRVMTGKTKAISPQLLELAGLEAVTPPTTYRRKEK